MPAASYVSLVIVPAASVVETRFPLPSWSFLVVFPGGFGTMDELMELLTLLQTAKLKKKIAVVVYGSGYWNKVLDLHEMVNRGTISREDLSHFRMIDTPGEAFDYLRDFLTKHYINRDKRG